MNNCSTVDQKEERMKNRIKNNSKKRAKIVLLIEIITRQQIHSQCGSARANLVVADVSIINILFSCMPVRLNKYISKRVLLATKTRKEKREIMPETNGKRQNTIKTKAERTNGKDTTEGMTD